MSVAPLRLLAIIEAYSITGPAKNLLEFAQRAAEAGEVLTTFATFTRDSAETVFTRAVRDAAARYPGLGLEIIPERGPFDPSTLRTLREVSVRVAPDLVQTHAVKSHFLARQAGLNRQAPWVAFHHGYTWPTFKARAYNQLDRWSLRAPRQIVTVCRPFADQLVAMGVARSRIEIVHNAIPEGWGRRVREPGEIARMRTELGVPEGAKVLLIVGRLSREKDHATLLEAMALIRDRAPAHLVIVGNGPEKAAIEACVDRLGLRGCVAFAGHRDSAEPLYAIADVAVLSSLSEGSPNALLEAMAAGIPVVSTAVGGVPEIVADGESALLVKPGDARGMGAAIARVLTEPGLAARLIERSHRLIAEQHEPGARMLRLVSIYRRLVNAA